MSRIDEHLVSLEKQKNEVEEKIRIVTWLRQSFPDLDYEIDRWKNLRYTSASVLSKAEKVAIRHSCGCCSDSPLLARPYVEVRVPTDPEDMQPIKVYSSPSSFMIGERAYIGECPMPGWRSNLLEKGVNEAVINQIELYFEANKPKACDEAEDEMLDELGF